MAAMKRHRTDDHDDDEHPKQRTRTCCRSKLPAGWLDCPAFGQVIDGCLIPSKVPLGEYWFDDDDPFNLPAAPQRYSHTHVIRKQRLLGRTLGLVIDLTNSTRYYNPADWKNQGINHVKIACKGFDSVPDNESVNKFVYQVMSWSLNPSRMKKYILVHCTHGHNRTGYMIVHYLVRAHAMPVTEAIKIFADARPPGIYKPDYVEALYDFYHENKPAGILVCPSTPHWKRSDDHDCDHSGNRHFVVLDDNSEEDKILTNDDVLGDKIPYDQELEFRHFCFKALKLHGGGPHQQFPGSHPVSLNMDNLQMLRQCLYCVTWKADGTRYMMLITKDGCYLIDRHFNFRRVQMRFPFPEQKNNCRHHFTLLDGEMVIDTHPVPDPQNPKKQERRYLIYDMMAINGKSITDRPFKERWDMIEDQVIKPRKEERMRKGHYRYDLEPFGVRRKAFWHLSRAAHILKKMIPNLSHAADGVIFQGRNDPYVPRTHEGLLKWKYPEMNSVDFLFEMVGNRQLLYLYDRGEKKLLEGNNKVIFPDDGIDLRMYAGKIIECSWDSVEKVWRCMRMRPDKGQPNAFYTYNKVMRSIKDHITEQILLNQINEIIRLPMYTFINPGDSF